MSLEAPPHALPPAVERIIGGPVVVSSFFFFFSFLF